MSYLMTPSLIGSIDWLKSCPPSWRDKAKTDLHNQLARIYSPPTPALTLGIKFENTVYNEVSAQTGGGSDIFKWFVDKCKGGQFQRKTSRIMEIDCVEFCLYGKLDAWWPDKIYDIKTTSNYHGEAKYLDSIQHKVYCLNENITYFEYLVAVFDDKQKLIDKKCIPYSAPALMDLDADVRDRISEAYRFIKADSTLFELYTTVFSKRS